MNRLTAAVLVASVLCATPCVAAIEPSVAVVQAAYEREAARDDPRHDKNLEVVAVECFSAKITSQYLCWVTFTSKVDPARTLYYDVSVVEDTSDGWKLTSGLCRR